MKVFYGIEHFDPDSTEIKKLYIKDVYLGDYSYGLYSKLQMLLMDCASHPESNFRTISSMGAHINGAIYREYGIDVWELDNPYDIKDIIREKTGVAFNEWLERLLKKETKEATDELNRLKGDK